MTTKPPELSIALAHLLQGPLYAADQPAVWASLRSVDGLLREHLDVLGMRLIVHDGERFAYLRAKDELPEGMPRLMRRHALTFGATVLLVLLRQQLTSSEAGGQTPRTILNTGAMVEMLRLYYREGTSDERVASDVNVLEKLGYLRRLRGSDDEYEVRRIVKAVVTADWLAEYGEQLLRRGGPCEADAAQDEEPAADDGSDGSAAEAGPELGDDE